MNYELDISQNHMKCTFVTFRQKFIQMNSSDSGESLVSVDNTKI